MSEALSILQIRERHMTLRCGTKGMRVLNNVHNLGQRSNVFIFLREKNCHIKVMIDWGLIKRKEKASISGGHACLNHLYHLFCPVHLIVVTWDLIYGSFLDHKPYDCMSVLGAGIHCE